MARRNALPILDFEFSVFFAGPLSFPVSGLPTKCTLNMSVDRMNDEPEHLGAPFTARWRGPCTVTVDRIIECTLLPAGSVGFLVAFAFYMEVVGVRRGPAGFIAPFSFKWLDF